jgi:hypothetical protein
LKIKTLALAMAIASSVISPASAEWTFLGARDVRDAVDHDVIVVEGARQFQRIRICAYERPVHIIDLDVHFANGATQDVAVRSQVRAGTCTRAIDLVGDDRNITSVGLTYEANTRRRGVHASVRLFGE